MKLSRAELVTLLECVKTELRVITEDLLSIPDMEVIGIVVHDKQIARCKKRMNSLNHLRNRLNIELRQHAK